MSDFWKGVIAVITLQWLFGGKNGGCGCSGCFTALVLGACLLCYFFGLF